MSRVVVLRALGLGDLLTAVPALRAVRRVCPQHHVTLLAPREHADLLAFDPGLVDEVRDTRGLDAGPLAEDLQGADLAVNLHGKGPQSTRLLQATRPRQLLAFGTPYGPEHRDDEHEVHRWCRMLQRHGVPADPTDLHLDVPPDPRTAGATIVHPGAKDAARRWPLDRYAQVVRSLLRRGERVVVTGGPGEERLAHDLAALSSGAEVLAGTTSLPELAGLVAGATRTVSGDTGIAHLATAVQTPSVVLFGPVPPREWGPPAHLAGRHLALHDDDGRRGDPHATTPDPRLLRIRPREVLAAITSVEKRPAVAPTVVG